jgi:curli biogenesis system outer membrane secretion channel CsgG
MALSQQGQPLRGQPLLRPTVSVPDFNNNVTASTWWWQGPVAQDLSAALANELQATGDLQVVERRNLKEVLSEQELADLGIVRKGPGSSAAKKGHMTGARYLVLGTVTSYQSDVESKASGSNFGLLGFGTANQQAETKDDVAIDIRVVDSTTGEVVGSRTVEGRDSNTAEARSSGVSLLPAAAGTLNFGSQSAQSQRTRGVLKLD